MASPAPRDERTVDPLAASTRVIESAVELARAELRLALTRAGVLSARAFSVLVAIAITVPFVQVTLALLALAPLIGVLKSPLYAAIAVAIPLLVSAFAAVFLYRAVRALAREWKDLARGE